VFAAISKAPQMDDVSREIGLQRDIALALAAGLISTELCLGVCLILNRFTRPLLCLSTILLLGFLIFEGLHRQTSGCTCFGNTGRFLGANRYPVYRDLYLTIWSFVLYLGSRRGIQLSAA
jgi:hypothetical protein